MSDWRNLWRDWCQSIIRVKVIDRQRCDNCMDCYNVCPEPQVLRSPLHGKKDESQLVLSKDCISCGRCLDVCAENVLSFRQDLILLRSEKW